MMRTKKTYPEIIVKKIKSSISVKHQDLIEDTERFVNCQI